MAEFQDVMYQQSRMCSKYGSNERGCLCGDCPLKHGLCNFSVSEYTKEMIKEAERIVMKWAAEHPEPKYPTWAEYLFTKVNYNPETFANQGPDSVLEYLLHCQIPCDIAQKIGIEPREATL